jgi:LysR family nitrogen assimilation transcriptional regulator
MSEKKRVREDEMALIDQFLEMKKLYYFRQVATSRSFRHAARQLGITQPALTRHVQNLEDELGVTLIHRHTSGNKLTEAGQLLAEKVDQVLAIGGSLKTDLMNLQNTVVGTVTVAISMGSAPAFLDAFLVRFMALYPRIRLRLMEGLTRHVEEWLESGQADVGVVCLPTGWGHLVQETLIREELFLMNTDSTKYFDPIEFPNLEQMKLVLPLPRFGTRQLLERMASQSKVKLSPILEADNRHTIKQVVLSTGWCAIDSICLFKDEIASGKIYARPIAPAPMRTIVLATSQNAALSSAARVTAFEIRRSIKDEHQARPTNRVMDEKCDNKKYRANAPLRGSAGQFNGQAY